MNNCDIFFKTQVIPDFGEDHVLVRIGLCDTIGRTFYAEYLDKKEVRMLNIARFDPQKFEQGDFLINEFGFCNEITDKNVKMLGTKDMVRAELKKWLSFIDKDVKVNWIGIHLWYDVVLMDDILWQGNIPSENIMEESRYYNRENKIFTYEYAVKCLNPLIYAKEIRR